MNNSAFHKVLRITKQLEAANIYFVIARYREDAISVSAAVPGERWEIDVLEDGEVDIERFVSDGTIEDESALPALIARFAEADTGAKNG